MNSVYSRLLVIVGPTASGKSALALKIAKKLDGEIIAADSRTIYRGMDIGTAKANEAEQHAVVHWGIDLVEPGERFSAFQFKKYAQQKATEIAARGKLPIVVGGTGLYIDGLLFDFGFGPDANQKRRQKLEKLSTAHLQKLVTQRGYEMPANLQNKRHLIRTIERGGVTGPKKAVPAKGVLLVGLLPSDFRLKSRISTRARQMFASGVLAEAQDLQTKYGKEVLDRSGGIVYKICQRIMAGELSQDQAIELFKIADWQYARRQKTWFKRNPHIKWFASQAKAYDFIIQQLS